MRLRAAAFALALWPTMAGAQEGVRREEPAPGAASQPAAPPKLTRPPQLVEGAQPVYPAEALADKLEADVTVRLSIDATGGVDKVWIVTPAGHGFDEAAEAAVRAYRFEPAEWDGKPGPIVIETTLHFRLETPAPASAPAASPASQPASAPGPRAALRGTVKERGTRRRLPGVAVAIGELAVETTTDAAGEFHFADVAPGTYHIIALQPGFNRLSESVRLAGGEEVDTTLYLRPSGGSPYETVVEGEREHLEVTRRTLQQRELTTVPGTFGDPLRVIQSLPGLARSPYLTGVLLIRGSNPDDSGVFVDGHRVPLLYHFLGGPSVLNPEFLGSIDLYPGGFPARFGRAIGGIVEVNTRSTNTDGIHGAADIDLIDTSVYTRVPLGDHARVAVAARRSYVDTVLPFFLPDPDPGSTLVVVPVYWDYQGRVDIDLPHNDKLSLLVFGSDDRLDVLAHDAMAEAEYDLGAHIGFHRARATYTTHLGPKTTFSISPLFGTDVVSLSAGQQTSTELTTWVTGTRERLQSDLAPGLHLDAGADLEYRVADYRLNIPNATGFNPLGATTMDIPAELIARSVDVYALGGYAELAWDVGRLRLIPGLRFDSYLLDGNTRASLDPRLVARYQVNERTALKAYGGVFNQPPQPEALDSQFGNPNLGLESAFHTGFGIEQKLTKRIEVDAEAYYVHRDDMVAFTTEVTHNPDGTITPLYWKNESVGHTYGLEVLLKHEVTQHIYGWLSYTLSRSEVTNHPGDPSIPTTFDETHNLIAVASYRTGDGWELGARFRLTSGRPMTPIIGSTYDADTGRYVPLRGPLRSERMPTFNELDIRLDKTWLFRTWMIGAYVDLINVYNADNPEATQWDYRFQQSAPVRGVPFFPTVGIKGQW